MKKRSILVLCILSLLFLVSCSSPWVGREYSFVEGFDDLTKIEDKFGASFADEDLNSSAMVPLENIDPFIEELEEFRENVKKTKDSDDKFALINFVTVRITMVLAQKNFQLAQNIGDIGVANDEGGFTCGEAEYLIDASHLYNKSLTYTAKARSDLDSVLYQYRKVPQLQELLGLDETKTQFYHFHLDHVSDILSTTERALRDFCRVQVVKN